MFKEQRSIFFLSLFVVVIISLSGLLLELSTLREDYDLLKIIYFIGWTSIFFYIYKWHTYRVKFLFSAFYQLFYFFGMFISLTIISFGTHMYEINQTGTANGSFWIFVIIFVIYLEFSYIGFKIKLNESWVNFNIFNTFQKSTAYFLIGITCFFCAYIFVTYGGVFFSGVNRVKFWGEIAPSQFSGLKIIVITTFFLVVLLFFKKKQLNNKVYFELLIIIFYLVSTNIVLGEKFSVFLIHIFTFLLVASAFRHEHYLKTYYKKVLLILFFLLIFVSYVYDKSGLGYDFVFMRLPLQGQLFWSIFNEGLYNLTYGIGVQFDHEGGARNYVDMRYLSTTLYLNNLNTGTGLSGYFPTILILFFGLPLSVFFIIFLSLIMGVMQKITLVSCRSESYLLSFFYYSVYFFSVIVVFVSNFNLIKWLFILTLSIIIFHFFISVLSARKKMT